MPDKYLSHDGLGGLKLIEATATGGPTKADQIPALDENGLLDPSMIPGGGGGSGSNNSAYGPIAERSNYDAEAEGFFYFATDTKEYYERVSATPGTWSAAISLVGPQGPAGAAGADGTNGTNFTVDAVGLLSELNTYDNQAEGFSFLATDNGNIYFLSAIPGVWSAPVPFVGQTGPQGPQGPQGDPGPEGPTGPQGENFTFDATGPTADRSLYNAQPKGFSFLDTTQSVLYVRDDDVSGQWSDPVPFTGPTGATGQSAYELAVASGFVGSEGEWLQSLTGPIGPDGPSGFGVFASAYTLANGTLEFSLGFTSITKSSPGTYVYDFSSDIPNLNYTVIASVNQSASDPIATIINRTAAGFTLQTVLGDGVNPDIPTDLDHSVMVIAAAGTQPPLTSAYETWISLGNVGTEQDFINSLIGAQGPQGIQGIQGETGPQGQSITPDVIANFADRSTYDAEAEGFVFMAVDTGELYFRETAVAGTWSVAVPFRGPDGLPGDVTTRSTIAGTTYTLLDADIFTGREFKKVSNAAGCTITVPAGLTNQEPCTFIQTGDGQAVIAPDIGVTIVSADDLLATRAKGSFMTLLPDGDTADLYYLTGDLA